MRIVLVTDSKSTGTPSTVNILLEKAFHQLALQQPAHEWLVMPMPPSPSRWSILNAMKGRALVHKSAADLVVYASLDNPAFISSLPYAILIGDKFNFDNTASRKKLSHATAIITHSGILREQLANDPTVSSNRIHVIPLACESPAISAEQRIQIRDQLTGGKEYFLYTGGITKDRSWERLLQAFSLFKKWQQSGMQLILSGNVDSNYKHVFQQQLDAYKYRQDIILAGDLNHEQKDQLAAAAFVLMSPFKNFDDRQHVINAFNYGMPVITDKNDSAMELAGDSVLYADWNDTAQLSQQMITLYKDERLYNDLVEKGKNIALRFNWQEMLNELSRILLSAAKR